MTLLNFKASRYNHFFSAGDQSWGMLGYNALSNGLAYFNPLSYEFYKRVISGSITEETLSESEKELLDNLKKGCFIVPKELDELQLLEQRYWGVRTSAELIKNSLFLVIMTTSSCNFACFYCYQRPEMHFVGAKMGQEVQDGIAHFVDRYFDCPDSRDAGRQAKRHLGVMWYGGEPLLGIDVIERLTSLLKSICKNKNIQYTAAIVTNGFLLTPFNAQRLKHCDVKWAQVTLDGSEEIHNRRRVLWKSTKGTYRSIVDHIKAISKDDLHINIRVGIDRTNTEQITTLLTDLHREGLHEKGNVGIWFAAIHSTTPSCQQVQSICYTPYEFGSIEYEHVKKAAELGFRTTVYPRLYFTGCTATSPNTFVIEPDGGVHKCIETVGYDAWRVGRITPEGLLQITNQKLYEKWLQWSPFNDRECKSCKILPLCMGRCPFIALQREDETHKLKESNSQIRCLPRKFKLQEYLKLTKLLKKTETSRSTCNL